VAEIGVDFFDPSAGGLVPVTPQKPLPVAPTVPTSAVESAPASIIPEIANAAIGPAGTINRLIADGAGRLEVTDSDLLRQLIREVRVTNRLLLIGLNIDGGDLEAMNPDSDYD
jgi:hypothetical protein